MSFLPKVVPAKELRNTKKIINACKESDLPIIITQNGYAKAVIMSTEVYDKFFADR